MDEPGLRERKKLETRRRIEDAALDLIESRGFDSITVNDVTAAADVAPRTFFRYFASKEDVVLADYSDRLARLLELLNSRPADEAPWESLRMAFRTVISDDDQRHGDMRRRMTVMAAAPSVTARSLQIQAGWENDLTAALERRRADVLGHQVAAADADELLDPTSALLAAAALGVMRTAIRLWARDTDRVDLGALVEGCFDRLAAGLQPAAPHRGAHSGRSTPANKRDR